MLLIDDWNRMGHLQNTNKILEKIKSLIYFLELM